ncbi:LysR family transcriptional regulator [Streptomyces sp. NPDC005407]|uniref:LysR family transcriptional regulator n=1 Tax=Streptomyces sp. NPDC005407 TaxID=3155340 RepID=UPI0033A161DD
MQSAVSRWIAALEQQAGGPLFERLPRGVRLNPAGRALHRHAVEMLDRLARAGRELAVLHAGHGGLLRGSGPSCRRCAGGPAQPFRRGTPTTRVPKNHTSQRGQSDRILLLSLIKDSPCHLPYAATLPLSPALSC